MLSNKSVSLDSISSVTKVFCRCGRTDISNGVNDCFVCGNLESPFTRGR